MRISPTTLAQTGGQRAVLGIFLVAALVNLTANLLFPGAQWVIFVSKVMLMPSLATLLYLRSRDVPAVLPLPPVFAALGACWLGDIALGLPGDFFIYGMAAFGLAHVFYIIAFLKGLDWKQLGFAGSAACALPFIVYSYMLYSMLYHHMTSDYRIPIAVYMVLLISNGISSLLRRLQTSEPSATFTLVGVVLFIQSDSLIAVTKFMDELPAEAFAIMATYILGQYLIAGSCVPGAQEQAATAPSSRPTSLAA